MRWTNDETGRFTKRPWYESGEIDEVCEGVVSEFLQETRGNIGYPISTEELTVLIERHTSEFDQFADLSAIGGKVQGITIFIDGERPIVRIDQHLQGDLPWHQNRFRTTVAHELGHVVFHRELAKLRVGARNGTPTESSLCHCDEDNIIGTGGVDWMEWQAGYASGAFLMPQSHLLGLITRWRGEWHCSSGNPPRLAARHDLVSQVKRTYGVSKAAAEVRLRQLGVLPAEGGLARAGSGRPRF